MAAAGMAPRHRARIAAIAAVVLTAMATGPPIARADTVATVRGSPVAMSVRNGAAAILLQRPGGCGDSLEMAGARAGPSRQLIAPGTPECLPGPGTGARLALGGSRVTWAWPVGGTVDVFDGRTDGAGERRVARLVHQPGSEGDYLVGPVANAAG